MKLTVTPSAVEGVVSASPSKSCTHRAIIMASLSRGTSTITNVLLSQDTEATINAMRAFGATIREARGTWTIRGGRLKAPSEPINCMNSGTTLRLCSGIASLLDSTITLTGDASLRSRPMKPLIKAFAELGVSAAEVPEGITVRGPNNGRWAHIKGDVSSQFISSLLISSALKNRDTDIVLTTPLISKPYVDITVSMMRQFGISCTEMSNYYRVMGGQSYRPQQNYAIPGDYSSAAFILAAGAIAGGVKVNGLDRNDIQGDKVIVDLLSKFGASVNITDKAVRTEKSDLKGISADIGTCPDLFPILAVLGTQAEGDTVLYNGAHLRHKESDRIATTSAFLRSMGADIEEKDDGCVIHGKCSLKGTTVNPQGDHRILMAAAIAALAAKGSTTILDGDCYNVSYPSFVADMQKLGAKVEAVE